LLISPFRCAFKEYVHVAIALYHFSLVFVFATVLEEYAGEKLGFYQLLANDEKIEFEFDWKMLTQDILETAKISQ
jgi:hypothetical protein